MSTAVHGSAPKGYYHPLSLSISRGAVIELKAEPAIVVRQCNPCACRADAVAGSGSLQLQLAVAFRVCGCSCRGRIQDDIQKMLTILAALLVTQQPVDSGTIRVHPLGHAIGAERYVVENVAGRLVLYDTP